MSSIESQPDTHTEPPVPPTSLRLGRSLVIAIDGPSGSGKSSVSREVARQLGLAYQDTGAMYRALTWFCLQEGIDLDNAGAVEAAAENFGFLQSTDPQESWVRVGAADVTAVIREPGISERVSAVATNLGARTELVRRQQAVIRESRQRIVVEGRDITTVVAPQAEVRLLLTASEAARLARRGAQLSGSSGNSEQQDLAKLTEQVLARDARDGTVVEFQRAADGVLTLDSSELDFQQTVAAVIHLIEQTLAGRGTGEEPGGQDD